jgi:hypothetical protein
MSMSISNNGGLILSLQELLKTRLKRSEQYGRHYYPLDSVPLELKKPFDAANAPVLSCTATLLDLVCKLRRPEMGF